MELAERRRGDRIPRWLRWGLGTFALCVLLSVGVYEYQRYQIRAIYAEMRSHDWPTNQEELEEYGQLPPGAVDNSQVWVPAITSADAAIKSAKLPDPRAPFGYDPPVPGQPWEHQPETEEFLQKLVPYLEALHRAAESGGRARFPNGTHVDSRSVGYLLYLESKTAAYHGDSQRRLKAIKSLLALSNIMEGEARSIIIMSFRAIHDFGATEAIGQINTGASKDHDIAELQRLICSVDLHAECQGFQFDEMISMVEFIQEESRIPFHPANELELLRHCSNTRPSFLLPWPEMLKELENADAYWNELPSRQWIEPFRFRSLSPRLNFNSFARLMALSAAKQACANGILAAERFRLRHGKLPASMVAIDADLFAKLPGGTIPLTDPMDGQPLRFRLDADGLRIYSVSFNGVDDGGDILSDSKQIPLDAGYLLKTR